MPITLAPDWWRPRTNSRWLAGKLGSTKMTFFGSSRGERERGAVPDRGIEGLVARPLPLPREVLGHRVLLQHAPRLRVGVRLEPALERPGQALRGEVLEDEARARAARRVEVRHRVGQPAGGAHRSEERRVGKECRCRWAPYR